MHFPAGMKIEYFDYLSTTQKDDLVIVILIFVVVKDKIIGCYHKVLIRSFMYLW